MNSEVDVVSSAEDGSSVSTHANMATFENQDIIKKFIDIDGKEFVWQYERDTTPYFMATAFSIVDRSTMLPLCPYACMGCNLVITTNESVWAAEQLVEHIQNDCPDGRRIWKRHSK